MTQHTASRAAPDFNVTSDPIHRDMRTGNSFPVLYHVTSYPAGDGIRGLVSVFVHSYDFDGEKILTTISDRLSVFEARELATILLQASGEVRQSEINRQAAKDNAVPTLTDAKADFLGPL